LEIEGVRGLEKMEGDTLSRLEVEEADWGGAALP
jgi:hypothetical protein